MGRYGVSPFEGMTENADRRLQAGEGLPLLRLSYSTVIVIGSS